MEKICVGIDADGYLYSQGAPDAAQVCSYVLTDSAAVELYPFNLTAEEGTQISLAILGVWAAAWGCRVISKMVHSLGD
jgi:hypothetical protein